MSTGCCTVSGVQCCTVGGRAINHLLGLSRHLRVLWDTLALLAVHQWPDTTLFYDPLDDLQPNWMNEYFYQFCFNEIIKTDLGSVVFLYTEETHQQISIFPQNYRLNIMNFELCKVFN